MSTHDFPQDLLDAQAALHQVTAERDAFAATLPWSAEPMTGWEAEKQPYTSFRSGKADSPGYTPEQAERIAAYQQQILDLSRTIVTHPYWATLSGPDLVNARTALKHAHESAAAGADQG
ncbi:hypothetical protein ACWCPT_29560 [Streptomyces sp. NPDC002308]